MSVARLKVRPSKIKAPKDGLFRLRIAGKNQPREPGFIGIDDTDSESVDYVINLRSHPWPIDDGVVDFIFTAFHFHRLPRDERYAFMDECWRILKSSGQLAMVMPHWSSMRAITDPLAQWPPLCESSFMVYSCAWREQERMTDLPLKCDFGATYGYGHTVDPEIAVRNDDFQAQAKKHWINAVLDLHVTLTKN